MFRSAAAGSQYQSYCSYCDLNAQKEKEPVSRQKNRPTSDRSSCLHRDAFIVPRRGMDNLFSIVRVEGARSLDDFLKESLSAAPLWTARAPPSAASSCSRIGRCRCREGSCGGIPVKRCLSPCGSSLFCSDCATILPRFATRTPIRRSEGAVTPGRQMRTA